jgi:hypothetical protein
LEAEVIMMVVLSGMWNDYESHAQTLQTQFHDKYDASGLEIVLVFYEDNANHRDETSLCNFAFSFENSHSLRYHVVVDPDFAKTAKYHENNPPGTPLTILIDRDQVIRFKQEGAVPDLDKLNEYIVDLLTN